MDYQHIHGISLTDSFVEKLLLEICPKIPPQGSLLFDSTIKTTVQSFLDTSNEALIHELKDFLIKTSVDNIELKNDNTNTLSKMHGLKTAQNPKLLETLLKHYPNIFSEKSTILQIHQHEPMDCSEIQDTSDRLSPCEQDQLQTSSYLVNELPFVEADSLNTCFIYKSTEVNDTTTNCTLQFENSIQTSNFQDNSNNIIVQEKNSKDSPSIQISKTKIHAIQSNSNHMVDVTEDENIVNNDLKLVLQQSKTSLPRAVLKPMSTEYINGEYSKQCNSHSENMKITNTKMSPKRKFFKNSYGTLEKQSSKKRKNTNLPLAFESNVRNKKRKISCDIESTEDLMPKPQIKRVKKKLLPELKKLSREELLKNDIYNKFNDLLNNVLEATSSIDCTTIGNDDMIQDEWLLGKNDMNNLRTGTEKLKIMSGMEMIVDKKLVRLLDILQLNIHGGDRISPIVNEPNESIQLDWMKSRMERVLGAADACLTCLYILTAPNMPKTIYSEKITGTIIRYLKFHLPGTIFSSINEMTIKEKDKNKVRRKSIKSLDENIAILSDKIASITNLLTELLDIQVLEDMSVIQIFSLGISCFFVENINELQLVFLRLLTKTFLNYERCQHLCLDIIIKLFLGKQKILRTYRLSNGIHIQMLTALVINIVQSSIIPSKSDFSDTRVSLICNNYKEVVLLAHNIVYAFFKNSHHKLLFENFFRDLLNTLNVPEWPVVELLLIKLGNMVVKYLLENKTDLSSRTAYLDCLGSMALSLKKQDVLVRSEINKLEQIVTQNNNLEWGSFLETINDNEEKLERLQEILLDFIAVNATKNETNIHAYCFYIAYWHDELEKNVKLPANKMKKSKNNKMNVQNCAALEKTKKFLEKKFKQLQEIIAETNQRNFNVDINYSDSKFVSLYIASNWRFFHNFDDYLNSILNSCNDSTITVRSSALKHLAIIIDADPSLFSQRNIQLIIKQSINDKSSLIRELGIDLLGKNILNQRELVDEYCEIFLHKIMDNSINVQKRVIKILKDICVKHPDFHKIPEFCCEIVKKINNEEGIKKIVLEAFESLWFKPTPSSSVLDKVKLINKVVISSQNVGLEWFTLLLNKLFKLDKESKYLQTGPSEALVLVCTQIVDCFINNMLEDTSVNSPTGTTLQFKTLSLFATVQPQLFVKHIEKLQNYLNVELESQKRKEVMVQIVKIFELTIPLVNDHDLAYLTQLEEYFLKLITDCCYIEIDASCLACLNFIVNNVTHNLTLIRDCYCKWYSYVTLFKRLWEENGGVVNISSEKCKMYFEKAPYIIGFILRYFDFNNSIIRGKLSENIEEEAIDLILFLLKSNNLDIQIQALKAIGLICIKYNSVMLHKNELVRFYSTALTTSSFSVQLKSEVLLNIWMFISEEVKQEKLNENKHESIEKNMKMAVIRLHLENIFQTYFHHDTSLRQIVVKILSLVLQQALVNPDETTSYLACMSTDSDKMVQTFANKQLLYLRNKITSIQLIWKGVEFSFQLQKVLQDGNIIRGFSKQMQGEYRSLNRYLYSLLCNDLQHRRTLILCMLRQFTELENPNLSFMLYLADNLACFPYMKHDDPLFIINHINLLVSVHGTCLLHLFKKGLTTRQHHDIDELNTETSSDDDDEATLIDQLPENTIQLQTYLTSAQGCLLLIELEQHLMRVYRLSKIKFLPKFVEKTGLTNKNTIEFKPLGIIKRLKQNDQLGQLDKKGKQDLIHQYFSFKQAVLEIKQSETTDQENMRELQNLHIDPAVAPRPHRRGNQQSDSKRPNKTPKNTSKSKAKSESGTIKKYSPRKLIQRTSKTNCKKNLRKVFEECSVEEPEIEYSNDSSN